MNHSTVNRAFFEEKYLQDADPWRFATSQYELDRYAVILGALGNRRFRRAFEPGCSIGVLTAGLAERCERVEALDISPAAIASALSRCRHQPHARFHCGGLPEAMPEGQFDLIVFSEIGYYFNEGQLTRIVELLTNGLDSEGVLVAAHWLGSSPDHLLSGDRVHEILQHTLPLSHSSSERHTGFRLDRWTKQ